LFEAAPVFANDAFTSFVGDPNAVFVTFPTPQQTVDYAIDFNKSVAANCAHAQSGVHKFAPFSGVDFSGEHTRGPDLDDLNLDVLS
jgi:hypothetical protein